MPPEAVAAAGILQHDPFDRVVEGTVLASCASRRVGMQHGRCEKGRRGTGESSSVENIGAVARILCHSADICHGVAMWRATALISVTCASGVHSPHELMWQVARNQR